ncbi:hypothetical protein M513_07788 [Trichuris suis]|uniref:Uncharacterized protein n=1 Tax=Trichuris suis TaxID=68888 RepID=A0A085M2D7_9BILA|nr:hypothetical protein M513_07788 [Trichuris suis]
MSPLCGRSNGHSLYRLTDEAGRTLDGSRLELTADVPANVGRVQEPANSKTSPVVDNATLMTGHG